MDDREDWRERETGKSVPTARLGDNEDIYIYIYTYIYIYKDSVYVGSVTFSSFNIVMAKRLSFIRSFVYTQGS